MSQSTHTIVLKRGKLKHSFSFVYLLADFILVNVALLSIAYVKRDALSTAFANPDLVGSFYAVWLLISLITNKFHHKNYSNYFRGILSSVKSNILILYCLLCLIFVFRIPGYLDLHIYETLAVLFLLEVVLFTEYHFRIGKDVLRLVSRNTLRTATSGLSVFLLSADFLLFTSSFFLMNLLLTGNLPLNTTSTNILLILYALWLTTSLLTRKFEYRRFQKIYHVISPNIKAIMLTACWFYAAVLLFGMKEVAHVQVMGTLGMSLSLGIIPNVLYSVVRFGRKCDGNDIESVDEVKYLLQQETLEVTPDKIEAATEVSAEVSLRENFLNSFHELYRLIKNTIDLPQINLRQTDVFYSNTDVGTLGLSDQSMKLLINLDRINDIRSLNRYFLDVHKKLANGGVFVCNAETIDSHRQKFMTDCRRGFCQILYALDFVYRRMLPRIPGFKFIYFAISRGRNRVISRAEFLGRLYFCGFKVLSAKIIDGQYYVIAQKAKTPSIDKNPSNDLLLKLHRIGFNGEMILLNKFRTMFPYSEYLQEYVYERNKLLSNGKLKNDFRITEWGKIFRKLWLDELPQFLNYFRGELNIVGVRALSRHYFELYPRDLQELRTQFKPGLIPPYYYDLPGSFEEIIESERNYLLQKQLHPLWTDVKYFTVALYNIFFRGARSK